MSSYFVPIEITPDNLTSTVDIDSDADIYGTAWSGEWSSTYVGGYSADDVVRKGINLYESQTDGNSDDPEIGILSETPTWIDLGKINRYRMFDEFVGQNDLYANKCVTSAEDEIRVVISGAINKISFFDLVCNNILAEIIDGDDAVLWLSEYDMTDGVRDVGSYSEYFFTPFPPSARRDISINLGWLTSSALGERVRLTLSGIGTISCGNCFLGQDRELGLTRWGVNAGVTYYGEFETDQYGRTTHIPGVSAKTHDADLYIQRGGESRVYRILKELLSKDVVFDLNNDGNYDHIITYGYISDFSESMEQHALTIVNIEIVGRI